MQNYVEPFFGSGAVLLGRPGADFGVETVNDKDGLVANFWRAVQHDPEAVARWADNPVNECDLHARHLWLLGELPTLADRLCADPDWHDAKVAGWWAWGLSCWIGSGWCSGNGPWRVEDGMMVDARQLPHLGNAGRGVNRKRPHLGNAGRGVNRKRPLAQWVRDLADRLRDVRVCCGDWSRVCGPSVTFKNGVTGVLLDPPYADEADRTADLYRVDCGKLAHDVREWALANGDNPLLRIALCGYAGDYAMPDSWQCVAWKTQGGYGAQSQEHGNPNRRRERIWFSRHCQRAAGVDLRLREDAVNARLVLADCPWREIGAGKIIRGCQRHYPTMPTRAIAALPVRDLCAPDAVLLLWATNSFLPDALDVCRAWRFRYVSNWVWLKPSVGLGQWRRSRHELLLLCVRGHPTMPDKAWPDSVIEAPRTVHSAKPPAQYDLARHLCPEGPWLELFCRTPQPGWQSFGNALDGADIAESLRVAAGRLL